MRHNRDCCALYRREKSNIFRKIHSDRMCMSECRGRGEGGGVKALLVVISEKYEGK